MLAVDKRLQADIPNVRHGSIPEVTARRRHVRFAPNSRHARFVDRPHVLDDVNTRSRKQCADNLFSRFTGPEMTADAFDVCPHSGSGESRERMCAARDARHAASKRGSTDARRGRRRHSRCSAETTDVLNISSTSTSVVRCAKSPGASLYLRSIIRPCTSGPEIPKSFPERLGALSRRGHLRGHRYSICQMTVPDRDQHRSTTIHQPHT